MNTTTLTSLPLVHRETSLTDCCPMFNPSDWDHKVFELDHAPFVKVSTHSFMHMPIDMTRVMRNAQRKISDAGADTDRFAILSFEVSPWHADHYIAVSKPVPEMENVEFTGTFMSRVFEGQYREISNWYRELINYVVIRNKIPVKTFFYYTTCPDCAKAYGANYVVGLEKVEEPHGTHQPAFV